MRSDRIQKSLCQALKIWKSKNSSPEREVTYQGDKGGPAGH